MNFGKGQVVVSVDRVNGKPYHCKILDTKEDLINIHYHRWNSKYDELLQQDSPRLVQQKGFVPNSSQSQGGLDVTLHHVSTSDIFHYCLYQLNYYSLL